jgi:hypothetical protein
MELKTRKLLGWGTALCLVFSTAGCMSAYRRSVGAQIDQVFTKVFRTDVTTSWEACLESVKSMTLDISNREAGYLQTRWTDNTAEKNFSDSFAGAKAYLKAQYRFKVSVAQAYYNGEPVVKVAVQREQMVQRDVLDGWKPIQSDGIEEQTLLYRISRIVKLKLRMARALEKKTEEETQSLE